jgi:glycosyltransferase involved in cell wall biosynthesis
VHAHLGPTFHWCALASIVERDPAFVATEHASANRRMGIPVIRGLERFIYSRYSRIACVSADAAAALRAWIGLDEAKIAVIPNGIHRGRVADGATIPAKDVVGFLRGRIGVAMTARLVPPKDHQTAMAALALLPKEYCLVLAGDGPDRQSLEERARSLGVADRCAFLGMRDDVPSVLAASSIYLQSSRVEGFGIAVLEAMAAGLPVAASEAPGLGNLVRGAGLLFPPGDAIVCAAAIRRLREDGNLAESLIEKGGARAAEYSLERCAAAYEELYRAASAERGQGRRSPAPKKV